MAKTVAFPVIGIGLDANPLKRGLQDAKASVAGTVAGIQDSAKKLSETKFATADVYGFKEESPPANAGAMDIVDKFNARKAAEASAKAAEKKRKEDEKAKKAAQAERERIRRETIPQMYENSASLIPKDLQAGVDMLLESERTAKTIYFGMEGVRQNLRQMASVGASKMRAAGMMVAKRAPMLAIGGLWRGIDSSISAIGNLPATLSRASMPINQTLELAAKANRLIGAPIRGAMAYEMGNNAAVYEGGRSALNDPGISGTWARFTSGLTEFASKIFNAIDSVVDLRGAFEALRGLMSGFGMVMDAFFGKGSSSQDLENMFNAGQDVAIDLAEQGVALLGQIYDASLDMYEGILKVAAAVMNPFNDRAYRKAFREDTIRAGLRTAEGDKIRLGDNFGREFFNGVREDLWWQRQAAAGGVGNGFKMDVTQKDRDAANKSLKDMVSGMNTGKNPFQQAEEQYQQALAQIVNLANAGAGDAEVRAARDAAGLQRDLAIMEGIKPLMQQEAQSRFSVSFEPNSQALIESMIRAQTGTGSDNPQERVAQAAELQNRILTETKSIQDKMLEAIRRLPLVPAVFVGAAG